MLISIVSIKGSPGATTTALAAGSRWPRRVYVADLDPLCGDFLAGVGRGQIPPTKNVGELVVSAPRVGGIVPALAEQLWQPTWPPGCPVLLPGLGAPQQADGVDWVLLSAGLGTVPDADVLADCGRWSPRTPVGPVLRASDLAVVVVSGTLRSVHVASRAIPVLAAELGRYGNGADGIVCVLVGPDRPYSEREVAAALRPVPVLATVEWDPKAAAVWSDGADVPRGFERSGLQRDAAGLAAEMLRAAGEHRAALHVHHRQTGIAPQAPGPRPPAQTGAASGGEQLALRDLPSREWVQSEHARRNGEAPR